MTQFIQLFIFNRPAKIVVDFFDLVGGEFFPGGGVTTSYDLNVGSVVGEAVSVGSLDFAGGVEEAHFCCLAGRVSGA